MVRKFNFFGKQFLKNFKYVPKEFYVVQFLQSI